MEGMCIFAAKKPFNIPTNAPTSRTNKMAKPQCIYCCNPTHIAAVSASKEPTEISKPAPIITKVVPMAIIPIIELCLRILRIFAQDKKPGVITDKKIHNKININKIPFFFIEYACVLKFIFLFILPSYLIK
jgi:hypothetical protein